MSLVQLQLPGEKEVSDVFDLLAGVVAEAKAKKGAFQIAADFVPQLVQLVGEVPALSSDLSSDLPGSLNSALAGAVKVYTALKS